MRLAFNSGEPPSAIAAKWPEKDLRELAVLMSREPTVEERLDLYMPQLIASTINPWRKKGSSPVSPKDVAPDWWGDVRENAERSHADWRALLSGMAREG